MKRHPCLKGSPNHPQEYLTHTTHIPFFFLKFYNHLNVKHQTIKHRLFSQLKNQSHQYQCFLHSTESTILFETQNIILGHIVKSHPGVYNNYFKIILQRIILPHGTYALKLQSGI